MPSTSKKQHNFMAAVAKNPAFAKKVGLKSSVGEHFLAADKGKKFGTGGDVNYSYGGQGQINKQRTRFGSKFGYKLNAPDENLTKYAGKKEGGLMNSCKEEAKKAVKGHEKRMHKMAGGGVTRADGCVSKGHTKGKMIAMCGGGMAKGKK